MGRPKWCTRGDMKAIVTFCPTAARLFASSNSSEGQRDRNSPRAPSASPRAYFPSIPVKVRPVSVSRLPLVGQIAILVVPARRAGGNVPSDEFFPSQDLKSRSLVADERRKLKPKACSSFIGESSTGESSYENYCHPTRIAGRKP